MRALARLYPLLALAAAVCAAPVPVELGANGVLVLRAACHLRDPAAFSVTRLLAHATESGRAAPPTGFRLLSYEETCGSTWSDAVVRGTLAALSAGGGLVSAGWPGTRSCSLAAAARSPQPAACAGPAVRAALLVRLAARLRWRRVSLLAGAARGADECAATLQAARAALLAAGLVVHRPALSAEREHRPDVVITCTSPGGALLFDVDITGVDASSISNITLDVGDLPYIRNLDRLVATSPDSLGSVNNMSVSNNSLGSKPFQFSMIAASVNDDTREHDETNLTVNSASSEKPALQWGQVPRLLLCDTVTRSPLPSPATAYGQLLDGIERDAQVRRDGINTVRSTYYLYEQHAAAWRPLVQFIATATRRLDDDNDWAVEINAANATDTWRGWRVNYDLDEDRSGNMALWGVGGAIVAVALLVSLGTVARGAAERRHGRRRRRDVVLVSSDFTFPADELRRVPEGMETMLSCWLQQLHEFGGPELERPDLLKQPAPPSAPSSTASGSRLALDRRTRYKGDAVHLKLLPHGLTAPALELRRKATDVLLVLHNLRHENLNPFIGCLCETRPALVFDHCGRGSLEDVLMADDIKLDWTFRLSLLTDLVKGLRYLHGSALRVHGRLSSRNCAVDSRWVLRLTDYGLADFYRAQGLTAPQRRARDLLWTAPELLRAGEEARGTQPGDVFSFAIIMQEVIVRGEPYCMLALSPEEILEKLCRPPPLIRPSVSMGAAPPEAVSVMRQCWAEPPDLRPDTDALLDIFRLLHRGRKINIVDSMFEMLEKYSNNLEELIKERTEQLDMEKKKTEQLLNRMLPRSVAERLVMGQCVEPEEFEEVSIYFSDIVGFTAIAARSTPVEVVALLNDLYTTFDAAIERYRVYKVETIGDAYMVVGGLPVRARDHAESVATMALHLLHLAGRFRIRHLPASPLHLRIGLHSGPCCAGVVGLTMPRYCLFGDTVNTASRMESTGAAWRIQVSAATAARLEAAGGYRLRSRGLTQIKGKGAMHTFWLLGKDGFDKPLPTPPPLPSEEALLEHEAEGDVDTGSDSPSATHSPSAPLAPPNTVAALPLDKFAWQRSGAVSADSSPPAAPYSRYRCLGGGRVLRRQWSLERGEALAEARAAAPEPALLLLAAGAETARGPRYRTRPDRDADAASTSTSFD